MDERLFHQRELRWFLARQTHGVVVAYIVDVRTDGMSNERRRVGFEQARDCVGCHGGGVEPVVPSIALQYDRHAVVDGVDGRARGLRDNRARFDDLAVACRPPLPNASEREGRSVRALDEERLTRASSGSLPLEKAVDDDETPALAHGLAERSRASDALGASQRKLVGNLWAIRPRRHEAPAQELDPSIR